MYKAYYFLGNLGGGTEVCSDLSAHLADVVYSNGAPEIFQKALKRLFDDELAPLRNVPLFEKRRSSRARGAKI